MNCRKPIGKMLARQYESASRARQFIWLCKDAYWRFRFTWRFGSPGTYEAE